MAVVREVMHKGHWAARPLPEPQRTRHASKWMRRPVVDRLGKLLEEWLAELKVRYTFDGD